MNRVPVLMYHHVNLHKGDTVTVTPEVFERQMEYLYRHGYRTLKADELISYIKGELILKEKGVVITFDDGWLDNYIYALPVLKKYRQNATIFIITDRIDRASRKMGEIPSSIPTHKESKSLIQNGEDYRVVLSWDLVTEMIKGGLVEFYSHTREHKRCDQLSEDELVEELNESKKVIEKMLNRPCPYLCWPYGKHSNVAVNIAGRAGYKAIFTTDNGIVKTGSDPLSIKRIVVKDRVEWFKKSMLIYSNSILSEIYLKVKK